VKSEVHRDDRRAGAAARDMRGAASIVR